MWLLLIIIYLLPVFVPSVAICLEGSKVIESRSKPVKEYLKQYTVIASVHEIVLIFKSFTVSF